MYLATGTYTVPPKGLISDATVILGEVPPGGLTTVKASVTPSATMTGAGTGQNRGRTWQLTEVDSLGQVIQGNVGQFIHHDGEISEGNVSRSLNMAAYQPLTAGNTLVFRSVHGTAGYQIAEPGGTIEIAVS